MRGMIDAVTGQWKGGIIANDTRTVKELLTAMRTEQISDALNVVARLPPQAKASAKKASQPRTSPPTSLIVDEEDGRKRANALARGICFGWQKGDCKRGDECRYKHSA